MKLAIFILASLFVVFSLLTGIVLFFRHKKKQNGFIKPFKFNNKRKPIKKPYKNKFREKSG